MMLDFNHQSTSQCRRAKYRRTQKPSSGLHCMINRMQGRTYQERTQYFSPVPSVWSARRIHTASTHLMQITPKTSCQLLCSFLTSLAKYLHFLADLQVEEQNTRSMEIGLGQHVKKGNANIFLNEHNHWEMTMKRSSVLLRSWTVMAYDKNGWASIFYGLKFKQFLAIDVLTCFIKSPR